MNRLIIWFKGLLEKKQCCKASPREEVEDGFATYFCLKCKGHFGKHSWEEQKTP
jgi:hypothetical protein